MSLIFRFSRPSLVSGYNLFFKEKANGRFGPEVSSKVALQWKNSAAATREAYRRRAVLQTPASTTAAGLFRRANPKSVWSAQNDVVKKEYETLADRLSARYASKAPRKTTAFAQFVRMRGGSVVDAMRLFKTDKAGAAKAAEIAAAENEKRSRMGRNGYAQFVRKFCSGSGKSFKEAAKAWSALSANQKASYKALKNPNLEKYRSKLLARKQKKAAEKLALKQKAAAKKAALAQRASAAKARVRAAKAKAVARKRAAKAALRERAAKRAQALRQKAAARKVAASLRKAAAAKRRAASREAAKARKAKAAEAKKAAAQRKAALKKAKGAKKAAAKKPAAKKPAAKKPAAKKPAAKKPAAKKPVAKKPVAKKPVAKKPAAAAKKPAAAAKKPAAAAKPVAKKN